MASKRVDPEPFEALYARLEETVGKLEKGDLSLADSLALYEQGMELARRCQELLQNAELRVTRLQEQFAAGLGELREEEGGYDAAGEPSEDE
jgi:exodeoxyribonuclease VII small subunit